MTAAADNDHACSRSGTIESHLPEQSAFYAPQRPDRSQDPMDSAIETNVPMSIMNDMQRTILRPQHEQRCCSLLADALPGLTPEPAQGGRLAFWRTRPRSASRSMRQIAARPRTSSRTPWSACRGPWALPGSRILPRGPFATRPCAPGRDSFPDRARWLQSNWPSVAGTWQALYGRSCAESPP